MRESKVQRTIPIIGIVFILTLSGIPTTLSFDNNNINQNENNDDIDWWPMYHHDLKNTGYSTSNAPNTNNILWNFDLTSNDIGYANNPIIYNKKLYFTSTTNRIYCLDSTYGKMIWSKTIGNITNNNIYSIPTIYNNNLFVNSYDGKIYCLNSSNGGIIWSSKKLYSANFTPKISYDKIYIGSNNHSFYCLNTSNGKIIWSYIIDLLPSSPALFDEKVYLHDKNGKVYCLNAITGEKIWTNITGGYSIAFTASPVIYNNKLYVLNEEGRWGDIIYCFNAFNGTLLWRRIFDAYYGDKDNPTPTIAYGKLYLVSSAYMGSCLYCLKVDNGALLWCHWEMWAYDYSSPAIADGKVYFGTNNYIEEYNPPKFLCLNANNGSFIWNYQMSINSKDTPIIADGKLYCNNGSKIFCFGNEIIPPNIEIISPKKDTLYIFDKNIPFISTVIIGEINIQINAYDNQSGINYVKLYIDNVEKKNFTAYESYVYRWDEKTFNQHIIKAVAYDKVGNTAEYAITVWKFF